MSLERQLLTYKQYDDEAVLLGTRRIAVTLGCSCLSFKVQSVLQCSMRLVIDLTIVLYCDVPALLRGGESSVKYRFSQCAMEYVPSATAEYKA